MRGVRSSPFSHRHFEIGIIWSYLHFKIVEYRVSILCFPLLDIRLRVDVFL